MGINKPRMDTNGHELIKIRKARKEDLKDIINIFMIEGKKHPYLHKFTKKKLIETFMPALKKKEMWVAEIGGKIIGFVWGGFSSVSKKIVYIDDLWILSDFQGKGIGKELMAVVEKYYKKKGVNKIRLTSYTESKAFGFYKKLNYRPSRNLVLLEKNI